ncbi:MAG: serine/threonine protein kinase [Acidobacteriota bacterium]
MNSTTRPEGPRSPISELEETLIQDEAQRQIALRQEPEGEEPRPVIPGFDLVRELGRGAYGEVWLAIDRNTRREVAIKLFSNDSGLDWPLLQREVGKLVQAVTERRVVQLLQVGWHAERPFYVMEFLAGGSLADRLAEEGTFSVEQTAIYLQQIAEGLVFLHGKAILHCDLKPANVLLDSAGGLRLADFGQARLEGEAGPAVGTFFYMPPEQASVSGKPDVRSDLYALGAVAHAMLTGTPPYASEEASRDLASTNSVTDRIERYREIIERADPPTAHRRVPGIDRALVEIIDRCMAKDPDERFENAQQVLGALVQRRRNRLQRPLLIAGVLGPLVLLLALAGIGYFAFEEAEKAARRALVEQSLSSDRGTARVVAAALDRNLSAVRRRVTRAAGSEGVAALFEAGGGPRARFQRVTDALYEEYRDRYFYSWVLADRGAVAQARSPYDERVIGRDYAYREWFSGALERPRGDQPAVAEPRRETGLTLAFRSTAAGEPVLVSVAAPVRGADQEVAGVLAATLELGTFNEWLSDTEGEALPTGCPERFVVLLNRGQLVRHPCPGAGLAQPPLGPEEYLAKTSVPALLETEAQAAAEFADPLRPGTPFLVVAQRLEQHPDWVALVLHDRSAAVAPVAALAGRLRDLVRIAAGVGLLVIGTLWLLLWRVTRPPAG